MNSDDYRHVPTGRLARLAQRIGKVFASASTWYRLVREHRWRRPRQRVHPAAPKVGIRAARPNEIWHIDTSVLRLRDGSRAYLQAVIDNFSRRVLAWKFSGTFDPNATVEILLTAAQGIGGDKPLLLADGGVENFNGAVCHNKTASYVRVLGTPASFERVIAGSDRHSPPESGHVYRHSHATSI